MEASGPHGAVAPEQVLSDTDTRRRLLMVLLAVLVGVAFDRLFVDAEPGISYPIWALMILTFGWWSTRRLLVRTSSAWLILVPALLLASTFAIHSNLALLAMNFLVVPVLLVTHSLMVTGSNRRTWWQPGILLEGAERLFIRSLRYAWQPFRILSDTATRRGRPMNPTAVKVVLGIVLSIPVLLIVVPLLASADAVFDRYLGDLTRALQWLDLGSAVRHTAVVMIVALGLFGFTWSFLADKPEGPLSATPIAPRWDATVALTMLLVLNVVYLGFSVIQFSYLYGGASHALPEGFTYAQYARRGFFELVAVAIINLGILLAFMKFVKVDGPKAKLLQGVSLTLIIIFTLNMLFSAHFKMSLYEAAYGLTHLRVFVHYSMGLLFVLFLAAWVKTYAPRLPLARTYVMTALLFYVVLNFINVDAMIARHNLNLYAHKGKLDVSYLTSLSDDAIPDIARFAAAQPPGAVGPELKEYLAQAKIRLAHDVPWQSFNYSRYVAHSVMSREAP